MDIKITWTITAIIAVSSFLSPIFVAIINNFHQRKLRKLELEYDMSLKKLTVFYENKKNAFSNFLCEAGKACTDMGLPPTELDFYAHAQTAILFASKENQLLISSFIQTAAEELDGTASDFACHKLQSQLSSIAIALNKELTLIQADITNHKNRI